MDLWRKKMGSPELESWVGIWIRNLNSELEFGIWIRNWNSELEFGIGIRNWNLNSEFEFGFTSTRGLYDDALKRQNIKEPSVFSFGPGGLCAPCIVWPLLLPTFSLFLLFLSFFFLRLLLLTHFGETPVCKIIPPPIFWHNKKLYAKKNMFFR